MAPILQKVLPQAPITILYLLALATTTALAHGDESGEIFGHGHVSTYASMVHEITATNKTQYAETYFAHTGHVATIYAHIILMVLAWVFVLPIAVMLSIASSRYTLPAQFVFVVINAIGVVLAAVYNTNTPDLYPNNSHHKIGWIITWVFSADVLVNVVRQATKAWRGRCERAASLERRPFLSSYTRDSTGDGCYLLDNRLSNDSGHDTASRPSSMRSSSVSTICAEDIDPRGERHKRYDEDEFESLPLSSLHSNKAILAEKIIRMMSCIFWKYVEVVYQVVDRIILPFGFIALTTGIVTFGRLFEGHAIFGGLAHWIKGGVFFWLGLFNLGRWSGSFAELGWAWNLRPRHEKHKLRPSAEFVESALILFYGSTNIFLEHLGGWGGEWSAQDLEHIAITVLFIGGGLCGILVESTSVRDLLNTTATNALVHAHSEEDREQLEEPQTYEFSLNPIPALVILLLGIMMSSHHQSTMISSMMHKQWGAMLLWASVARGLTYVLFYLRPPTSVLPSRPPTELLASFGLIAGGIIFMASSSDTVEGMIHYDLDAMFFYTVTVGLVGMLMAWEIIVLAIKGWATRKERTRKT